MYIQTHMDLRHILIDYTVLQAEFANGFPGDFPEPVPRAPDSSGAFDRFSKGGFGILNTHPDHVIRLAVASSFLVPFCPGVSVKRVSMPTPGRTTNTAAMLLTDAGRRFSAAARTRQAGRARRHG